MTILEEILQEKELEVARLLSGEIPPVSIKAIKRPSLVQQLRTGNQLAVIAEVKRASPSKGAIQEGVDPARKARLYELAGAACISVLTDTSFFKGSFTDLAEVAGAVEIPVLCKDFIIHPIQIDRAKAAGASVVLLIVSALPPSELTALFVYAQSLGLEVLVEVHNEAELWKAVEIGALLIGVNNRDLRSFSVDLSNTEEIAAHFPFDSESVLISESGILQASDAARAAKAGASAVLVGEMLMKSKSPHAAIQELQVGRNGNPS